MNDSSNSELALKNNRKRNTKTAVIYSSSLLLGLIIGLGFNLHEQGRIQLSPNIIIICTIVIAILMFLISWIWFKSLDEFEKQNFHEAGNLAFHSSFIAFPWYLLSELNIAPEINVIVLLGCMGFVFLTYYYGKKFL